MVGEPSYSEVVAVRLAGSSEFTLLTDPVSGRDPQLLTASESALPMQFRLTDLFGNLVGYWEVPTEKDKTRYPVSTDLLNQTGIYVLTVTQGPRTFTEGSSMRSNKVQPCFSPSGMITAMTR